MTATKTVDAFLDECDIAPSLLLAVDDEPTPRADVYGTFKPLGIFRNSPENLEEALTGVSDLLAPEMESISRKDGIILLPGYEEATEVGWELMQKGIMPTVKVFDIRIEKEAGKNPLNGVQARYDLAGFDQAPVVYFSAFSRNYIGENKVEATAPVYLVEKGGAGTTEKLRDVVTVLEYFGKIMRRLEAMLAQKEATLEKWYDTKSGIEKKIGVNGKDIEYIIALEGSFDLSAYDMDTAQVISQYSTPEADERIDPEQLTAYIQKEVMPKIEKGQNVGTYNPMDKYDEIIAKISAKEGMIDTIKAGLAGLKECVDDEGFTVTALQKVRVLKGEMDAVQNDYDMQFADEWLGIDHVTT